MNEIILNGMIKDIDYSHTINDTEFYKANLITTREDGKEDILSIKFKRFSNTYKEGDKVALVGNLRTYNRKVGDKSKVELFVFTYFDEPEDSTISNKVLLSGRICKKYDMKKTTAGKDVMDFILANNLIVDN